MEGRSVGQWQEGKAAIEREPETEKRQKKLENDRER